MMIIATLVAFFIKGLAGFANTLVFTSILSFGTNNINISPMELILGYPSNIIISWRERKNSDYKVWLPLSSLVIIGSIPGMIFLKKGNAQNIKVIFGIVVVLVGLEMIFREHSKVKRETSKLVLITIGMISGLLCGLYGVGALLAAYVSRTTIDSSSFKGNICIVFIIENTFRIIMYFIMGIINKSIIINAIKLMPFMIIGLILGIKTTNLIPEKGAKKIVIILLMISGAALIINNI